MDIYDSEELPTIHDDLDEDGLPLCCEGKEHDWVTIASGVTVCKVCNGIVDWSGQRPVFEETMTDCTGHRLAPEYFR